MSRDEIKSMILRFLFIRSFFLVSCPVPVVFLATLSFSGVVLVCDAYGASC